MCNNAELIPLKNINKCFKMDAPVTPYNLKKPWGETVSQRMGIISFKIPYF